MRRLAVIFGCAALFAACSGDLFHDTDWKSRCDIDPADPACSGATGTGTSSGSGASSGGGGGGAGGADGGSGASSSSGAVDAGAG